MSFNYNTYTGRTQIDDSQDIPLNPTPSLQNNVFLYGNRRALANGEVSLPVPQPQPGYPMFSYYQTYKLNDNLVTNPDELLSYFSSCGYQVNRGYSGTTSLNNIGAYSPTTLSPGKISLYFTGQALNVSSIANRSLTGTFTITTGGVPGTITGTLVSVSTKSSGFYSVPVQTTFSATTVSSSPTLTALNIDANLLEVGSSISGAGIPNGSTIVAIVSSSSITISNNATASATTTCTYIGLSPLLADTQIVLNSSSWTNLRIGQTLVLDFVAQSSIPDVNNTEPFIMNLWQGATAMNNLQGLNPNATVGAPAVYFAILPDAESTNYFQATGNNMAMGVAPSSVATSGVYTVLSIPITADYASFIPLVQLGNSTITQATTNAVGTVFQTVVNGNMLEVQLQDVDGTFNTTNLITLKLDNEVSIMDLQNKYFISKTLSLRNIPLIYEVKTNNDISNTYSEIFDYVGNDNSGLNAPQTANNGQGNCSIIFGNISIGQNLAPSSLPTSVNSQYYEPIYFNFVSRPGVPYQSVGQVMCAMSMVMASNIYPFNPLNDILISGLLNSPYPQDWIDMSIGGNADQIIALGYNVIATDSNGEQYLYLGRSGRTTINGVADKEFYPSYVLDTKDYRRRAQYLIAKNNGVGQVRQNSRTFRGIELALASLSNQMANDGILANVNVTNSLIKVARSVDNPLGVTIFDPIQQNAGLLYAYGTIVNYSINLTLG